MEGDDQAHSAGPGGDGDTVGHPAQLSPRPPLQLSQLPRPCLQHKEPRIVQSAPSRPDLPRPQSRSSLSFPGQVAETKVTACCQHLALLPQPEPGAGEGAARCTGPAGSARTVGSQEPTQLGGAVNRVHSEVEGGQSGLQAGWERRGEQQTVSSESRPSVEQARPAQPGHKPACPPARLPPAPPPQPVQQQTAPGGELSGELGQAGRQHSVETRARPQ